MTWPGFHYRPGERPQRSSELHRETRSCDGSQWAPAQAWWSGGPVSLSMWTRCVVATTLMLVAAACGGDPAGSPTPASTMPTASPEATSRFPELSEDELLAMSEPISVRGEAGVRLEGRLFGSGEVGVVLAHMGASGDQSQWFELAGLLAERGFGVLTFNRRGSCPGGDLGCSGGRDDGGGWKDLPYLVERLREAGVRTVVVGGASRGAMESLYALSRGLDADGLIWVSGVDLYQGVPVTEQVGHVTVPKLFIAGEFDDEPADLQRVFERTAPEPTQIVTLDTGEHGTDILDFAPTPIADEFRQAVLDFLEGL